MSEAADSRPLRRVLLIEAAPLPDALARILAPFAVVQAPLAAVDYRLAADSAVVRLELTDLDATTVDRLAARIAAMPIVRRVGAGWRSSGDDPL